LINHFNPGQTFKGWTVVKDDISDLDGSQETMMREDMFQASKGRYTIDCGWYGDYPDGCYITYIVRDAQWDKPVVKIESRTLDNSAWSIDVCRSYVDWDKED
jgi:hypothetical protein